MMAAILLMLSIMSIRNPQNPLKDLAVYNGTLESMEWLSIICLAMALSR